MGARRPACLAVPRGNGLEKSHRDRRAPTRDARDAAQDSKRAQAVPAFQWTEEGRVGRMPRR